MIEKILPPGVVGVEAFDDPAGLTALPAEEPIIGRAVEKRRREFITARHCARAALSQLGSDVGPIMRGEKGEPLWPRNVVGSITHTDGYPVQPVETRLRFVPLDGVAYSPREDFEASLAALRCDRVECFDRRTLLEAPCDALAFLKQAILVGIAGCRPTVVE